MSFDVAQDTTIQKLVVLLNDDSYFTTAVSFDISNEFDERAEIESSNFSVSAGEAAEDVLRQVSRGNARLHSCER